MAVNAEEARRISCVLSTPAAVISSGFVRFSACFGTRSRACGRDRSIGSTPRDACVDAGFLSGGNELLTGCLDHRCRHYYTCNTDYTY